MKKIRLPRRLTYEVDPVQWVQLLAQIGTPLVIKTEPYSDVLEPNEQFDIRELRDCLLMMCDDLVNEDYANLIRNHAMRPCCLIPANFNFQIRGMLAESEVNGLQIFPLEPGVHSWKHETWFDDIVKYEARHWQSTIPDLVKCNSMSSELYQKFYGYTFDSLEAAWAAVIWGLGE